MALTDRKKSLEQKKVETKDDSLKETKDFEHGAVEHSDEDVFDGVIDLTATRRKRFNVNRGSDKGGVLYLNTSDMSIINRLEQLYPKLQELSQDAAVKQLSQRETDDEKTATKIAQALTKIDSEMRIIIDDIFDSNVSEVCAPEGSMFDPFNGEFRFEHIIDVISKLYEDNISEEFQKMANKLKKRTSKYTKGK